MIRLKKIRLFSKIGLSSVILVLCLLTFSARADNNSIANDTDNLTIVIIVNDTELFSDKIKNITVDDTLKFGIWDNKSGKLTKEGNIKIGDKVAEIKPQNIIDMIFSVVGVSSGNFAEYKFDESPEAKDYSVKVVGEYSSKPTRNTIIINVKSNYITRAVGKVGKQYDMEFMKSLNNRSLKFHKNIIQKAENLINKTNEFLEASNDLQNKISNLADNPQNNELKNSVSKVKVSQEGLKTSLEEYKAKIDEFPLIKENSTKELDSINEDIKNINSELISTFNAKKDSLLKNELAEATKLKETRIDEFETEKSDYRTDVFNPAGALILLGIIIGFINVNRWKKESEYFGLYTSKANITSPVIIAIILTLIILILIAGVVYSMTGNFDMLINTFKFLI